MEQTYSGWKNYATWRVNLELIDDEQWFEYIEDVYTTGGEWNFQDEDERIYDLSKELEVHVDDLLFHSSRNGVDGLVQDFASAFLGDVSWYQIAKSLLEEYAMENI